MWTFSDTASVWVSDGVIDSFLRLIESRQCLKGLIGIDNNS